MTNEIAVASAEINEILKYLSEEQVSKIPTKLREALKDIAKKDYNVYIDPNKSILEQNITPKTKDILVIFYRNYWSNSEKRTEIDKILIENEKAYQEELSQKYNVNDIFKNSRNESIYDEIKTNSGSEEEKSLVVKKENFFSKIIKKIKCEFFGRF